MQPENLLITWYRHTFGSRHAALTALRQRSHESCLKNVNAQQLEPFQNSNTFQNAEEIQTDRQLSSAHFGDADKADQAESEANVDGQVCRILEEARMLLKTKWDCGSSQIPVTSTEPCLLVTTVDAAGDRINNGKRSSSTTHASEQQPTRPVSSVSPHNDRRRSDKHNTATSAQEQAQRRNSVSSNNGVKASKKPCKHRSARRLEAPSPLEEARRVLKQVQKQKKILDENLDCLQRVRPGEFLYCHPDALSGNDDSAHMLRDAKTIDTLINRMTQEIQEELASEEVIHQKPEKARTHLQQKSVCSRLNKMTGGDAAKKPRGAGAKTAADNGSRRERPDALGSVGHVDEEAYLTHLYGRRPYVAVRRTLKKDPYLRFSSAVHPSHKKQQPQLVESVRGVKVKSCKTQTSLLCCSSGDPQQPQDSYHPSRLTSNKHVQTLAEDYGEVVAIPLALPKIGPSRSHSQYAATSPPRVSAQRVETCQPSTEVEQPVRDEALPPPSITVEINESNGEQEECVFPGAQSLHVADIQEEERVESESVLLVDGAASPEPVQYQGPVFPPQTVPPPQPLASQAAPRDPLVERMVEWVEQHVMSTMIAQMVHRAPSDPTLKVASDHSELEESVTSDIVEAAGGGGLQLFVNSNVDVDSVLIRQLVNEVLAEIISQMLGQQDTPDPVPDHPDPGEPSQERVVSLLPTPAPTPPASPLLHHTKDTPLHTPTPSEPASLLEEEPPEHAAGVAATPIPSPEPAPSPPPLEPQAPSAPTWEDAELPLDEERPEENPDTCAAPLVMSVAQEEPLISSPHPPRRSPSPPVPSPPASPARTAAPAVCSQPSPCSSSSSSSDSSSADTPTEAAINPISEGELLISVNHLAITDEDVVGSTSSSLLEMDFDPPSEGQVKGHTLQLTEIEQGVSLTPRGERPQPEGSWGGEEDPSEVASVGEVKEDWTVKHQGTTDPIKLGSDSMAGHSVTSPGQVSQCGDEPVSSFDVTNQSSVTLGDLTADPNGTLTSEQQGHVTLSPPATAGHVVMVKRFKVPTAEEQQQQEEEAQPFASAAEEEVMEESVSAAGDSGGSSADTF
ncbi:protein TALPID3 isoform 2-T2 [Synchiropus picturatus]